MPHAHRETLHHVALVLLSALAVGCITSASPASSNDDHIGSTTAGAAPTATAMPVAGTADAACRARVRIGVLLDKSGSTHANVVPQLTAAELDALIGIVDRCGGDLAIGVLCNVSGERPFTRLFLDERVATVTEPARRSADDVFTTIELAQGDVERAKRRREGDEKAAAARSAAIDIFRTAAVAEVDRPVTCTRTDVIAGVNRLTNYLAEPVPDSTVASLVRVGVYVTDGADNVRRQQLRIDASLDATHLLVGGSPDVGVFAPLKPLRFESMGAALRWVHGAATVR